MRFNRLLRDAARVPWERVLFLVTLASVIPLLWYLPTPENLARLLNDEFRTASEPYRRGEWVRAARTLGTFLDRHPGSAHEAEGRLLLARVYVELADTPVARPGDFLKPAADMARRAQAAGADPAAAREIRLQAADRLAAAREWDRAHEVYSELLAEDALPDDRLLAMARALADLVPPDVDRALERVDRYLAHVGADADARVAGLLLRADLGQSHGRPEVARAALQEALPLASRPDAPPSVRLSLARLLHRAGDYAAVEPALAPLTGPEASGEDRALAEFWCGRADLARDRIQEAIARFRAALDLGQRWDLRFSSSVQLASAFRRLRELRPAHAHLEDAARELGGADPAASRLLELDEFYAEVRLLVQLSTSRELLTLAERITRRLSADLPVSRRLPVLTQHADAAERLAQRIDEEAALSAVRPEELALLRAQAVELRVAAAGSRWSLVDAKEPSHSPGGHAFLAGVDLCDARRFPEAIVALRRFLVDCLFEDPAQPRALYLLGACYRQMARYPEAREAYRRCVLSFPDAFPDAYSCRLETGMCFEEQGEWELAEAAYLEILDGRMIDYAHPVWRRSLARLGEVYHRMHRRAVSRGDTHAAELVLGRAIARLEEYRVRYPQDDPESIPVLRTLGACYLQGRDWARAAAALERAVTLGAGSVAEAWRSAWRQASLLYADALFLGGRTREALERYADYRQRWGSGTGELWTLHQIAACNERLGDAREAARHRELYRLALERMGSLDAEGLPTGLWPALVEDTE